MNLEVNLDFNVVMILRKRFNEWVAISETIHDSQHSVEVYLRQMRYNGILRQFCHHFPILR